jgi:branched-chain amino acid transport system substrate-binding protein
MPTLPRLLCVAAAMLLVFFLLPTACSPPAEQGAEEPEARDQPIRIGVLVPLSGSLRVWGVNSERGIRLAADQINEAGGIDGRPIELLVEDSECTPETAVGVLEGWIDAGDVPAVLGAICSSNVLAMAPVAEAGKVVVLSTGASNPAISYAGDFIFRNWPSDRVQGHLTADYAIAQGLRKAAILYVDNAYGQGLEKVFTERFEEHGGTIALSPSESYAEGDTDFSLQLEQILATDADVLYLPAYTKEYPAILAQARELGLEIPIIASETFDDPETIERSGEAAEGVVFPSPGAIDRSTHQGRDFARAFEAAYGEPPGITSDTGYDALNLIAEALSHGARSGPEMRDFLSGLEGHQGVAGTLAFDANGEAEKEIRFFTVSGGVAEALSPELEEH